MDAATEFTAEQLNYFRICYVVTNILSEGLRKIFKQEWDKRCTVKKVRTWRDQLSNGMDFYHGESPKKQRENRRLLSTMVRGNTAEWDCTMLFYAILFSDSIHNLNGTIESKVHNLRNVRNDFAHVPQGDLSDDDFRKAMDKVIAAFEELGLSTARIEEIRNQTSFPTGELTDVLEIVKDLKKELQGKEKENEDLKDKLKDQLKQSIKQKIVLKNQLKEKDTRILSLINQRKETEDTLNNQLKKTENQGKVLESVNIQLQKSRAQKTSLEDQIKEQEEQITRLKNQLTILENQIQNDLRPFCILPPKPSHDVARRHDKVAEVMEQLKKLKQANETMLSFLYISGNPGSGKSQLAGLVAEQFYKNAQEDSETQVFVMTLNAETLETLLESYVSFARQIKCSDNEVEKIQISNMKTQEKIDSLMSLISTTIGHYGSWLLIADNVKSLEEVHLHLPQQGNERWARGQLVITTQGTKCMPLSSSSIEQISMSEGMSSQEARSLLALISGISDSNLGEMVAAALDYQPLALASAATYVKQLRKSKRTSNFGWSDFLKTVGEGQLSETETILEETNLCYKKSMTKVTRMAVKEVMDSDKVMDYTFGLLSFCAPLPLSLDIVLNYIINVDGEMKNREMIIMKLQRCSLILLDEDYIRVHQVVHDAIKAIMKSNPERLHAKAVEGAFAAFHKFVEDNSTHDLQDGGDSVQQSYSFVPHLDSFALNSFEDPLSKVNISEVDVPRITRLGQICESHCYFLAAKKYYECSLAACRKNFEPEDVSLATIYAHLGTIHLCLGEFEQAKEYHQSALNTRLEKLGAEHVDVAASYNTLGSVYEALGEFERAKECYGHALNFSPKKVERELVTAAITFFNFGSVNEELGEVEQAMKYYERALEIRKKLPGNHEHVHFAAIYNNLGSIHERLGNLEKAREYYHLDLSISLKRLGPFHVDVATTFNNLGCLSEDLCDFELAKQYHELALTIRLERLGPQHVDVADSYNNLGSVYQELLDFEQAKKYYNRALNIRVDKSGSDHVDVGDSYNNLGSIHHKMGDFEQAKAYHTLALNIRLKRLGPQHVDVVDSYDNLASVFEELIDFEQAKKYYNRALNIRFDKLGSDNVDVGDSYNNLGSIHHKMGDYEQAKAYHTLALKIRLENLGPEHVDVAGSYNDLASVSEALSDFEQAEEYRKFARGIGIPKLGQERVSVVESDSPALEK